MQQWRAPGWSAAAKTGTEEDARRSPLVAVVGPTGSGKSALALALAEEFRGEIVNCDSVQLYRGFDIGAAKTPPAARRGIPHHLIDIAATNEVFTAGEYVRRAAAVLEDLAQRRVLPVIVGGTGFYLRALLDGLSPGPQRDEALRRRLLDREAKRPGALHRLLRRFDPAAAARIHANDRNKTLRALEMRLLTGRPLDDLFARPGARLEGFRVLKLGLNPRRDLLYERLDRRFSEMMSAGLLDEVLALLASGVPETAKPFESLGYKQALQVALQQLPLDAAIASAQLHTRRYAKRQMTWFRREPGVIWLSGFGDDAAIQGQAQQLLHEFITQATV